MRVVSGSAKGMKLLAVPGDTTRPILDRVKTSLFDILRPHLEGMRVLDVFAGSGAVGIEALSQGAAHCTFIDLAKPAVETIKKNLAHTNLTQQATVLCNDSFRFLKNNKDEFDLVYVAPPQYKALWINAMHAIAERPNLVAKSGMIIAQIDPVEDEDLDLTAFIKTDQRKYGSTLLNFYQWRSD